MRRSRPAQIAQGAGDAYLAAINQALADWGKPVYVRPFAEMNGYWNAYSAFNQNGSARDAAHSTAAFRKAFARVYLILHGGPGINARLARLGLPPVQGTLSANPNVRVVWNPQGYGDPDLPGNSAQAYYPGDRYVDVVGDDLYDIRGKASWPAAEALYQAHPGKPFSFPEWGLWDLDDPAFVTQMGAFLRSHPRTEVANYYSGRPGSIFDLATKPRSRAAYRAADQPAGLIVNVVLNCCAPRETVSGYLPALFGLPRFADRVSTRVTVPGPITSHIIPRGRGIETVRT